MDNAELVQMLNDIERMADKGWKLIDWGNRIESKQHFLRIRDKVREILEDLGQLNGEKNEAETKARKGEESMET